MNNKGFVASSLIYSFFVAILLLMTLTINNYIQNENISSKFSEKVRENIDNPKPVVPSEDDPQATDVIENIEDSTPSGETCTYTLANDGTDENNRRYIGSNPCNYALFNNEVWRIIGVMYTYSDGVRIKNIKIVREEALGYYSWDSSEDGIDGAVTNEGINDWSQADLMKELNGDYLNYTLTENQMWYNGQTNKKEAVYDYTKGLSKNAQKMIKMAEWNLGGQCEHVYSTAGEGTPAKFYGYERGTKVWIGRTETAYGFAVDEYMPRSLTWTGKVGLIYPSDLGFAVGGSARELCLQSNLDGNADWYTNNCKNNVWLQPTYTLTPYADNGSKVFFYAADDNLWLSKSSEPLTVRPVVYLKSDVGISSGDGTPENPYVFSFGSN